MQNILIDKSIRWKWLMALLLSMPFGSHAVELVDQVNFVNCPNKATTYLSEQDKERLQKDCLMGRGLKTVFETNGCCFVDVIAS